MKDSKSYDIISLTLIHPHFKNEKYHTKNFERNFIIMSNNSYLYQFYKYVSSNVISMIGLSCYILIDTFFISLGLGANGLAALNLAIPMYSIVNGVGLMLGIGGAAKFIIFRTQNNKKNMNQIFMSTIAIGALFGALFVFLGIFFADEIAIILGSNEGTHVMASVYIQVIFLFAPAFILNNILSSFTKNDGAPRLAMIGMLSGSAFNILFDYIFIFVMRLGMFGAVLATGFSPVIGILILSTRLLKKQSNFSFALMKPVLHDIRQTLTLGFPSLINEVASGLAMIVFNILILKINGNVGIAAYGVITNIYLVVISIFNGVAQGAQPLFGEAYGEGNIKKRKLSLRYALITELVLATLIYIFCFIFAKPLIAIFNNEGNVLLQELAVPGLKVYFTAIPFMGINIIISMYLVSMEKGLLAQLLTLLRGIFLLVPFAYLLSALFKMNGIWITLPLTEAITTGIIMIGNYISSHYRHI